jgi:hypothetical protein
MLQARTSWKFADAAEWLRRRASDEFQESKVKRDKGGKFAKQSEGKAPKLKKKPATKGDLYAKVKELGIEKSPGKYEKATKAKLEALIAGHHGWKPSNSAELKGAKPKISPEQAKSIKEFLKKHSANLRAMEKAKANEGKPFKGKWTPAKATAAHKLALGHYTDGHYREINNGLRKGYVLDETNKADIAALDELTKASTYKGKLWRGVSKSNMQKFEEAGLLKPGAVISDAGFGSFSSKESFARGWKHSGLTIEMEGGKGCAEISSLSHHPTEDEILVARNTKFYVTGWDAKTRTLSVSMKKPAAPKAAPKPKEKKSL